MRVFDKAGGLLLIHISVVQFQFHVYFQATGTLNNLDMITSVQQERCCVFFESPDCVSPL